MQQEELQELVRKYLTGTASVDERTALRDWYTQLANGEVEWPAELANEEDLLKAEMLRNILGQTGQQKQIPVRRLWPRIAAAASILIALSIGGYFALHKQQTVQQTAQTIHNDVTPGSNKAILTLANGKKIVITGASNGTIATQANMVINKTAEGKLNYQQTNNAQAETMMNTTVSSIHPSKASCMPGSQHSKKGQGHCANDTIPFEYSYIFSDAFKGHSLRSGFTLYLFQRMPLQSLMPAHA